MAGTSYGPERFLRNTKGMRLENSMTKRRNRPHKNTGGLKALLLTASVMATLGGARLLGLQEPVAVSSGAQTITIVEPATNASFTLLPQSGRKTTIELQPIPQAVVPNLRPIARAHSSM